MLLGIACIAFLLYANTLQHGFVLDDFLVVVDNQSVQKGFGGLSEIWTHSHLYGYKGLNLNQYRPFPIAVFAIQYQLFGMSPIAFHLSNVIVYTILCALVLRLSFLTFPRKSPFYALAIAILFTTHAVHTEVVANIKSSDELFGMLFGISSLVFFLKYQLNKSKGYLGLSLLLYLCALFSKENTITLIAIFPLYMYFFFKKDIKSSLLSGLPFLGPLAIYFVVRIAVLSSVTTVTDSEWEVPYNNTLFAATTMGQLLATNCMIFLKYCQLAVFPVTLVHDYSIGTFDIVDFTNVRAISGLVILLVMGAIAIGKFASRSTISFALLFFLITFSITSNFVIRIGATLGERFLFLPSFGIAILVTTLIFQSFKKWSGGTKVPVYFLLVLVIAAFYSWKTIDRNADWKNGFTLASQDVKANPKSARIQEGMGNEYLKILLADTQQIDAGKNALLHYTECLKYLPESQEIYYHLGVSSQYLKQYPDAIGYYQKALVRNTSSREGDLYYNLGLCYDEMHQYPEAVSAYVKSTEMNPDSIKAWTRLSYAYFSVQDYENTIRVLEKCNTLTKGQNIEYLTNLGVSCQILKRDEEAKGYYRKVLAIDPMNEKVKKNLAVLEGN